MIVLEPSGAQQLAEVVGASHAVAPLTIRGFLPAVDLDSAVDARRHRVLSTTSLANRAPGAVRVILGRAARRQAAQRPLPEAIYQVRRGFQWLNAQQVVERLPRLEPVHEPDAEEPVEAVEAVDDVTTDEPQTVREDAPVVEHALLDQLALVRELRKLDHIDRESLERIAADLATQQADRDWAILAAHEIETQEAQIERLQDRTRDLERVYDDLQLEYAVVDDQRTRLADEGRWLRSRLAKARDFEAAHGQPPDSAYVMFPQSFGDLAARLDELRELQVLYTGDTRDIVRLEPYDALGAMAHFTWEALLTLADYCRCRAESATNAGVHDYLKQPPPDRRTVSPKRHAAKESEATMNQHGGERVFAVPLQVNSSEKATMQAHFKLGWVGEVSPRLHYLDAVATSGLVVVGYIGPHLPIASA